jgi:hypothetical protein
MPSFDPNEYTTVPARTPAGMMSLARGLLSAAASRPNRTVAARLVKVRERASTLQQAWIDVNRPAPPPEDGRPFDITLDRAWTALRSRLTAWDKLEPEFSSPRAAELDEALFPTGLDFLQLRFRKQWAESDRRLEQIKSDELGEELEQLAGAPFVAAVKQAHQDYGRVLGITHKKADPVDATRVLEPLQALRSAIASYARAVVGLTDEDDDEAVAAMTSQLRPLVESRRSATSAPTQSEQEIIEQPLPDAPTVE